MSKLGTSTFCAAASLVVAASPAAAQTLVTTFPDSVPGFDGVWFESDVRNGGAASIVDLTGVGGNLDTAQPIPVGAAKLTTGFDNADKAEVGVRDDYGKAADIFPTLSLSYWFHKASNSGQNLTAAPSIKLEISSDSCSGLDCFGTLVYEPSWNNGAGPLDSCDAVAPNNPGSVQPALDEWIEVLEIDSDSGCFWWSGGFGQANSFGGPPLRTLSEWLGLFGGNVDFGNAEVTLVSVGVGTFNQGQIGYFDSVEISHGFGGGFDRWYDFDLAPEFSCVGFEPPMDKDVSIKKPNRVLPLKMQLFDENGLEITDLDLTNPPVVEVDFNPSTDNEDQSEEITLAGRGDEGNTFTFDQFWGFNLSIKNFDAPGEYKITAVSGDQSEYVIAPTCTATFFVE